MVRRSILSDEELTKGAQAIADDMRVGDTKRLKLARIIDDHLDWFDRARARGLEWTDIIELLLRAGVTRPDGRPLSRGHLSSLVWRKQKAANGTVGQTPATALATETGKPKPNRKRGTASGTARQKASAGPVVTAAFDPDLAPDPNVRPDTLPNGAKGEPSERDKVLAYMRRAARARSGD